MKHARENETRRLVRALGWFSLALGVPMVAKPEHVARLVGMDDSPAGPATARGIGARELVQGVLLLGGPAWTVWTRVLGDAFDLAVLADAAKRRSGERRRRASYGAVAVAGLAAFDTYAALRSGRDRQHRRGRPGPLQLQASTTVNRSPEEVYEYWRDFENLPTFMLHLQSVTVDGKISTWRANAPLRRSVTWRAEMTGDEPGRRISWRSLPGSRIDNSGTVHFEKAPNGSGTEVRVVLHYDIPGGALGRAVAKIFGEEPEQQVRDDLRRFKQMLETGEVVRSDGLPQGTDARHQVAQGPAQPKADPDRKAAR